MLLKHHLALAFCLFVPTWMSAQDTLALGFFEGQSDVGHVLHAGGAEYNPATKQYTVSGSGENMWSGTDEFHYVWKKVSSENVTFTANISILGTAPEGHRKGVLMIRQSLNTGSAYVDVARHGDGLTSLQFREKEGAITREIESNVSGPAKLRIEKQGNRFYMWVAMENEELQFAGGSARVEMRAPFYIGIGVCAHQKDAVEKVAFSNVALTTAVQHQKANYSTIETVLLSGDARAGYVSREHVTSPGWSVGGHQLTFAIDGRLEQAPFTPLKTAVPVGPPVSAPAETKDVYYSSGDSGASQIWHKIANGSQAEQLTSDEYNNESPFLSPDGKLLLFLSYSINSKEIQDNQEVSLRLMLMADKSVKTLATFVGGKESLGSKPWSPDGRRVVFVSYQSMQ